MYRAVTRNIEVQVRPFYLEDRSDPSENRYVWGYQVTIDNQSDDFVQLMSRYWHITDGSGRVERCAAPASSATSPSSIPATVIIHVRLPALDALGLHGRATTPCATKGARRSTSPSRRFRWICRGQGGR